MKINNINAETVKNLTTQQLMDMHRKMHMLYSGAKKLGINNPEYYQLLLEKHDILVGEMIRRKYNHNTPLKEDISRLSLLEAISYELTVRQIKRRYKKIVQQIKLFYAQKKKQKIEELKQKKKQFIQDLKNELLLGKINQAKYEQSMETMIEEVEHAFLSAVEDYKIAERQSVDRVARQEAQEVVQTAYKMSIDDVIEKGIETYYKTMKKVTIATAIILISNKMYRDYLTISARACSGRYGLDKEKCIKTFKRQALRERQKYIQAKIQECKNSENPNQCIERLNKEINSVKAKIDMLRL